MVIIKFYCFFPLLLQVQDGEDNRFETWNKTERRDGACLSLSKITGMCYGHTSCISNVNTTYLSSRNQPLFDHTSKLPLQQ